MAVVTMKQLLEAGVHFGHQTRRWNPKMRRFIFGERNGIYIIDLQQTLERIDTAYRFVRSTVADGGTVLLGGIKRLSEGRNEFGVPLLSKVPYINRLFKNVSIGRNTNSLMMMVTPRIIIQEEEEERLGIAAP